MTTEEAEWDSGLATAFRGRFLPRSVCLRSRSELFIEFLCKADTRLKCESKCDRKEFRISHQPGFISSRASLI